MATLTRVDLRGRVAKHLKISASDIPLGAEKAADIDESINDAFAELRERALCWWDDDEIPQACVFALTLIVSAQACIKVGKAGQGYESGDGDGRTRLVQLRDTNNISELAVDYF